MRWPWQKPEASNTGDAVSDAALYCFNKHHEIVISLVGAKRLDRVPFENSLIAACETVCCYLHFVDRTLRDTAPSNCQQRMDRLVMASIGILSNLVERLGSVEKERAHQLAYDQFLEIYNERGEEYASVGDNWFKKVLLRYATHLVQILNEDDASFELVADPNHSSFQMVMKAEELFARGFGDLMKAVPPLFKP